MRTQLDQFNKEAVLIFRLINILGYCAAAGIILAVALGFAICFAVACIVVGPYTLYQRTTKRLRLRRLDKLVSNGDVLCVNVKQKAVLAAETWLQEQDLKVTSVLSDRMPRRLHNVAISKKLDLGSDFYFTDRNFAVMFKLMFGASSSVNPYEGEFE
jgi:hypothetical protein